MLSVTQSGVTGVFAEGVAETPLRLAQLGDHIDGAQGGRKIPRKLLFRIYSTGF